MKSFLKIFNLFIIPVLLFSACTSSTRITGSWTNPKIAEDYDNVLVAAMVDNMQVKQQIEDELAEELRSQGINVSKSIELFPPNFSEDQANDKDAMLEKIRGNGHDAILTVALLDKDTETRYVPGSTSYAPATVYSFWGYYTYWYPQLYAPGYYTEDKVYFLETNLYDASTENLVWSAQSESVNPAGIETFSEEFAELTVEELNEDRLL